MTTAAATAAASTPNLTRIRPSCCGVHMSRIPPCFVGMLAGTQGPAGFDVLVPVFGYTTNTLKDDNGNVVGPRPQVTSLLIAPGISWVTRIECLGANLGGSALLLPFLQRGIEG